MRVTSRPLFAVAGLALVLAGACSPSRSTAATPAPQASAKPAQAAPFDQQFIDMMVPHHQGAVQMAQIAQERGQRPEIKAMAADIIKAQDAEIQQLTGWRAAWFGSAQTPPLSQMPMVDGMGSGSTGGMGGMPGHDIGGSSAPAMTMDMAKDVEALRQAPEPFDRAFIDAMIPHHESAIVAARAAGTRAQRPEIKELARAIIRDQEREIAQMKEWRQAWFPG